MGERTGPCAPHMMTDQDGEVVWDTNYVPFGATFGTGSIGVTNNFRFPGQYEDEMTALYYNHHRYYVPDTGRYNQVDQGKCSFSSDNVYVYASLNPIVNSDPLGLFCIPWLPQSKYKGNSYVFEKYHITAYDILGMGLCQVNEMRRMYQQYEERSVAYCCEKECGEWKCKWQYGGWKLKEKKTDIFDFGKEVGTGSWITFWTPVDGDLGCCRVKGRDYCAPLKAPKPPGL